MGARFIIKSIDLDRTPQELVEQHGTHFNTLGLNGCLKVIIYCSGEGDVDSITNPEIYSAIKNGLCNEDNSLFMRIKESKEHLKSAKPPLGIMPKNLFYEQIKVNRFHEIKEAIRRRLNEDSDHFAPQEWLDEYAELRDYIESNNIKIA